MTTFDVLRESTAARPTPPRTRLDRDLPSAVRLRGLTKSYGEVRAVQGIDLTVRPGELIAVLGPNGAGKSTVNELILGLVRPDAGEVTVFDGSPREAVRTGRVGAMLQAGALLSDARVIDVLRLMRG